MIPWKLLDQTQAPGNGEKLSLYQHDSDFSIKSGNYELMNSRVYGSEDALARLGCQKIAENPGARVLIGGLGMGYTVRTALDNLKPSARVVVAEMVPAVVRWNQGVLAHLAGNPLDDHRVTVQVKDVAQLIKAANSSYDAILLDVDNGPQGLVKKENDWLYARDGLNQAYSALKPAGVLAVWSSGPDVAYRRRLRQATFEVEEFKVRARGKSGKGGAHHVIWRAQRSR